MQTWSSVSGHLQNKRNVSDECPDAAHNKHIESVEAIARGLAKRTGPKPGKSKHCPCLEDCH